MSAMFTDSQKRRDLHLVMAGELLTPEEAVSLLRLDQLGLKNPKESLRYLRRSGQLGYVKVAGKVLIPRQEISAYLERQRIEARQ